MAGSTNGSGGYFSNHSHSRFQPGSANSLPQTHATQPGLPRLRSSSSSKHFSLSLTSDEKEKHKEGSSALNGVGNGDLSQRVHPLRNTWVIWFQQRSPGNKVTNYEEGIKKISAFSSVESFWSLWTHLNPPSSLTPTTDYLLFHSNVRRPVWEDPLNVAGGKWIIRLRKGIADRLWEDLVLAVIGDQFDERGSGEDGDGTVGGGEEEICGCTISVRQAEDILAVWNRRGADTRVTSRIRDTIRRVLNLPQNTIMEYKSNNDSIQDKSSFRTTPSHVGVDRP